MSAFSALRKQAQQSNKPQPSYRVVPVPPTAFASSWGDRPREAVQIGLRLIADDDAQTARGEAAKVAWLFHREEADVDNRADAFNDALMRWMVARGTCRPDDVTVPWFDCAEDTVRIALTSDGVRLLWNEIERLHLEESPLQSVADDEDLAELTTRITPDALAKLPSGRERRLRRLIAFVLAELE